jgi:hypothetical protein
MKNNQSNSEKLVRTQHRAARSVTPLSFVAGGLALTLALLWLAHPTFAPVQSWQNLGAVWLAGLVLTLLSAIIFWQLRKRSLLRSAAEIDAALATHNRLEMATALHTAQNPMAQAQREETEQFLQSARLSPRRRGLTALLALSTVLALAHLVTLACWARPVSSDLTAKKDAAVAAVEKKPAAPPAASIEWQLPEPEAAATAIEEVPLEAEADSSTGLRDVVLEVEVNGEHKLSQPLTADLRQPGKHTLKPSLYLDQLEVKTYDMVSYHLRAQRISSATLPETVSPVQFVQVKPMREDTFICAGGDQPSKCFNYVTALKAAQLQLMKENFALAHAGISTENEEWRQENSRVGGGQTQLAVKTEEVIELMTTNNYPPPILELVRQSQPLMTEAGDKIGKTQNRPALAPQGKALSYLTEVEKYLKSSIKLAGASKQPKANDPFQKPKNLDLKTHPLTPAGKVDALAQAQAQLAGDLASGNTNSMIKLTSEDAKPDAEPIAGTPGERQADIKKRIQDLLDDPAFKDDALKHLQSSDDLTGKSQEQIANQDLAAASEPAAEAARELRQTATALRADDGKQTKNQLADALLKLSAAAHGIRKAAQSPTDAQAAAELKKSEDAVKEAAKKLEEEAQRQQANGATNAAARLNEMAKLLQDGSLQQMQAQVQQSPRDAGRSEMLVQHLDDLAQRAAQLRNQGQPTRQELANLVERMQRTQANLNNLASQCNNPGAAQAGKSPGQSQGQGQKPSPTTSGSGVGMGQQPSIGLAGSAAPNAPVPARDEAVTHARATEPSRDEQRAQLGENLMRELREETLDAMGMKPDAPELKQMRDILNRGTDGNKTATYITGLAVEIDPPMTGLITVLREDLSHLQRHYRLTDQQVAQAPAAYRPAVADYFEQLSRDYATGKPDGASK